MKKAMKQSTLLNAINIASICMLAIILGMTIVLMLLNSKLDAIGADRYDLTHNANLLMNGSAYLTSEVRAYAVTGKQKHYDNYWNEVNVAKNRDIGVSEMQRIGLTGEEQKLVDEMKKISDTLIPLESEAMESVKKSNTQSAINYVFGEQYESAIEKIGTIKTNFLNLIDNRTNQEEVNAKNTIVVLSAITIGLIAMVIIFQFVSIVVISKQVIQKIKFVQREMDILSRGDVSSPVNAQEDSSEIGMLIGAIKRSKEVLHSYITDITSKLDMMSHGDITRDITTEYIGDFAPIKTSLNQISKALNDTFNQIKTSTADVAAVSEQLASTSQILASGSTQQASEIEHLASAISNVSGHVMEITQSSNQASNISGTTCDKIDLSNKEMNNLLDAMEEINMKSSEIRKIIKTVEDIAFQTNILALNAAVEAARAGSAGKGFAVVADEVRNLANKSSHAAKQTTVLIEDSIKSVEKGADIAHITAKELGDVVVETNKLNDIISHITLSATDQNEAVSQINIAIEQINTVVQSNSATAEECAATTDQLSRQASIMKQEISHFKLKEKEDAAKIDSYHSFEPINKSNQNIYEAFAGSY